jgi:hypothetical protein
LEPETTNIRVIDPTTHLCPLHACPPPCALPPLHAPFAAHYRHPRPLLQRTHRHRHRQQAPLPLVAPTASCHLLHHYHSTPPRAPPLAYKTHHQLPQFLFCRVSQPRWVGVRRSTKGGRNRQRGNSWPSCCPAPRSGALAIGGYKRPRGRERERESLMHRPVLPRGQPSRTRALDLPFIGVRRGSRCTMGGVYQCANMSSREELKP